MNLKEKLLSQGLSDLEALEFLRQARGTSKNQSTNRLVDLAFGRGYRVVGPSATLEELLVAPSVDGVRVPVGRREQPALFVSKEEADCFSLRWCDVLDGEKVHREGTRLYPLDQEASVVEFLSGQGCDPVVVYRKRQEPIIQYELQVVEPPKEPPAVVDEPGEQYQVREAELAEPPQEPLSAFPPTVEAEFLGQVAEKIGVENTELTESPFVPKTLQGPEVENMDLQPIPLPVPVKRPGRPKAKVQLTEAERKAAYRLKLKAEETRKQSRQGSESVSVLDAYEPIVKDRGGKTSSVPKNLLVKRVVEQGERCIYCDRRFGSLVLIDGQVKTLKAQPDHFQPVADRKNDNPSNIHAADQICNERIKGSRKFASLEEARRVIQAAWIEHGWKDAPLLVPFQIITDPRIYCMN